MGWTSSRYDDARSLIFRLRDTHDRDLPHWRPHAELIDFCAARLDEPDLVASLQKGWTLARGEIAAGMAHADHAHHTCHAHRGFRARRFGDAAHPHREPGADRASRACGAQRCPRRNGGDWRPRSSYGVPRCSRRNGRDRTAPSSTAGSAAPWRAKLLLLSLVAGVAASAPSFIGNPANPLFERASPASGERNATTPVQGPRSSLSANGAAAPAAPEAEPANPAGNANDRVARSQRDQVADAPEPAASIGTSGGLAPDEPRPASATPREQAIVANAAPAPVVDARRESFFVIRRNDSRTSCPECSANTREVRLAGQARSGNFVVTVECDADAAWPRTFVGACERTRPLGAPSACVCRCAIDIALSRSRCDGKPVGERLSIDADGPLRHRHRPQPERATYCATRRNARLRRRGGVDHRGHRGYACVRAAGCGDQRARRNPSRSNDRRPRRRSLRRRHPARRADGRDSSAVS